MEPRHCKKCRGVMSYAELAGFGRVWQCPRCVMALEGDDGGVYVWNEVEGERRHLQYHEEKTRSRKPCPECAERMWEVVMTDFGSRWQCEVCRLTVFKTGGVQRWRSPPPR